MPLTVGGCSSEHLHAAGRVHPDACALIAAPAHAQRGVDLRRGEPTDLDVARDADTPIVSACLCLGAALLEALVVRHRERAIERGFVVAAVVGDSADRVERECVSRDEVLAAHLGGVHADLVSEPVHHPLDQVCGLGPAGTAVRVDRRRVGVGPAHFVVERRDPVRARHDEHVEDRRDARGERLEVRADVGDRAHAQAENRAIALRRKLDVRDVVAPVDGREVTLAPLLGPLHRSPESLREESHEELLGVDLELAAEAAADLGCDHAHLVLSEAEVERRDELDEVRDLGGGPERELAGLELRRDRPRLDRVRDQSLVDDPLTDLDLGVLERLVDVATLDRIREDEVGAELLVNDRRPRLERLHRVDHDRKRLVVDRDQVGCALGRLARVGDDRGDRVARVPRLVGRDRHVLRATHARNGDEYGQHARRLEVLAGEHGHDAGLFLRGRRVDPTDSRVRVGAAHKGQVRHAGKGHVIRERPLTRDEARVFLARDARADVGRRG